MKKLFLLLTVFIVAAAFCFADPVEGYWLSFDEKTGEVTAGWQIYQQGGKLYGKILSVPHEPKGVLAYLCKESYKDFPLPGKVNQMPLAGIPLIYGLTKDTRNNEWSGGRIIDPADGKDYNCKIIFRAAGTSAGRQKFTEDTLEMRGEIGLGIGRSQYWKKTDEATASGLWPN